jgi:hypothetical protein
VKKNATVDDTVKLIQQTAEEYKESKAVNVLLKRIDKDQSKNPGDWLFSLFSIIFHNTEYEHDESGKEQIKTPDRFLLKDKKGDCDDYTVLLSAVLRRLNVKHFVKIVKYDRNKGWAHVYVVVPAMRKGGKKTMIVLDLVLAKNNGGLKMFNQEVSHVESKMF